jgi:orotate phosphoribosyltransferase
MVLPVHVAAKRQYAGSWEYLLDEAIFTTPAHSAWSGAGLINREGKLVGVGSLIDRSGGGASFSVKRASLATVKATTWKPEECPLCKAGSPAIKPGSRA